MTAQLLQRLNLQLQQARIVRLVLQQRFEDRQRPRPVLGLKQRHGAQQAVELAGLLDQARLLGMVNDVFIGALGVVLPLGGVIGLAQFQLEAVIVGGEFRCVFEVLQALLQLPGLDLDPGQPVKTRRLLGNGLGHCLEYLRCDIGPPLAHQFHAEGHGLVEGLGAAAFQVVAEGLGLAAVEDIQLGGGITGPRRGLGLCLLYFLQKRHGLIGAVLHIQACEAIHGLDADGVVADHALVDALCVRGAVLCLIGGSEIELQYRIVRVQLHGALQGGDTLRRLLPLQLGEPQPVPGLGVVGMGLHHLLQQRPGLIKAVLQQQIMALLHGLLHLLRGVEGRGRHGSGRRQRLRRGWDGNRWRRSLRGGGNGISRSGCLRWGGRHRGSLLLGVRRERAGDQQCQDDGMRAATEHHDPFNPAAGIIDL